jgi:membrane protein YqaA with SNARE-associated domain
MSWRLLTEFLASVGYGLLSSFVPVVNSEVYVIATQTLGITAEVTAAIGVAVGQTIGKVAVVLALRHGTRWPFLQRHVAALTERSRSRADRRPPGRIRLAYRRWSQRLLALVGHPRWGVVIVFVSGATGVPPIFAVQFLIPPTTMPVWLFGVVMLLGRCVLLLAVAFGASALVGRLFS